MGKDLPKPHSWLVTELDFTHVFSLPVRRPFPPHSLVPSRYHLAAQRCERKGGCEVPALRPPRKDSHEPRCSAWAGPAI